MTKRTRFIAKFVLINEIVRLWLKKQKLKSIFGVKNVTMDETKRKRRKRSILGNFKDTVQ